MSAFSEKPLGSRIVLISSGVALAVHAFPWVDVGIMSASGFQQTLAAFMLFYIYPFYCAAKDRPIKRVGAYICGALAIASAVLYISSKQLELFGRSFNAASTGVYLFIVCSIALIYGVSRMPNNTP